jgi:hypothetical protein
MHDCTCNCTRHLLCPYPFALADPILGSAHAAPSGSSRLSHFTVDWLHPPDYVVYGVIRMPGFLFSWLLLYI